MSELIEALHDEKLFLLRYWRQRLDDVYADRCAFLGIELWKKVYALDTEFLAYDWQI